MATSSASLPENASWTPEHQSLADEQPAGVPRFDTLLLALTAGMNLCIVRFETSMAPGLLAIRILLELGVAVGLWVMLRMKHLPRAQGWGGLSAGLLAAACYPAGFEWCLRLGGGGAEPLEIVALNSVLLGAIVLSAFAYLQRMAGLSVLLSSSLLLFATTITTSRLAFVLAGVYGILGLWWLMGSHWERLEGSFIASTVERKLPIRMFVVGTTGLVAIVAAVVLGTAVKSTYSLRGFMPTSGGNRWNDPQARSGVGDGDDLVAAQDQAHSFGAVESELFLDSEMPSLYDVFDETYGEPRSKKEQERSVALDSPERDEPAGRMAQSKSSGREFSIFRRRTERRRKELADREAPAMFYVIGQTPVHLALQSYDEFNGRSWEKRVPWEEDAPTSLKMEDGHPWIYFRSPAGASVFRGEQRHSLKVINLKTNRIPSSPCFAAVHIDRVDRRDFFDWTDDGMVELTGRKHIPQLTVIHLRAFGLTLSQLRSQESLGLSETTKAELKNYLSCTDARVAELAKTWSSGHSKKWQQVEAVVARLRSSYEHDRNVVVPEGSDPVAFLLESGCGPDYLFATTATLMLRSLGCPTRLVSGFYAKPERYDRRAGQTAVLADDVHFWAEVCVDGQNWVPIEATPGYAPPSENLTLREWAAQLFTSFIEWCAINWGPLVLVCLALIVSVIWRASLLDQLGTIVCRLMAFRSPEARVYWTLQLLEWRAWLAGRRRPQGSTVANWYGPLKSESDAERRSDLDDFFRFLDHLLYSPRGAQMLDSARQREACRAAANVSRQHIHSQLPQLLSPST